MSLKIALACSSILTIFTAEAPAFAQTQQADETVGHVEEIIVTARKKEENIQTTPVAVTALTTAALTTRQVLEIIDLARTAPNLNVITGGSGGAAVAQFAIRGQAQANITSSNDSPVGLYVDGVYYARAMSNNGAAVDLAGVQVLRGPQGTLFGRNTTGGAVVMTSNEPVDEFGGRLVAGIGNYNQFKTEAVLNLPLNDEFLTRFAGSFESRNGYVFNANTGKREGDMKNYFVRGGIKWAPAGSSVTVRIIGDATDYTDNGSPSTINIVNSSTTLGHMADALRALPGTGFYTSFSGVTAPGSLVATSLSLPAGTGASHNAEIDTPRNRVTAKGVSAAIGVDLGGTQLKSITAWRESNAFNSWDLDALPMNGIGFASEYSQHQVSEELQLSGKLDSFEWITGLYLFREAGTERSDAWQFAAFSRDLTDWTSRSIGLFAQGTYHIADSVRFTGGIRYTWDRRTGDLKGAFGGVSPDFSDARCGQGGNFGLPAATNSCSEKREGKFHYPAWLASLDWQISRNSFAYLKTSGASMAGGVNFRFAPASASAFDPENVRDVELGFKTDLFDRRVRFNTAFFHIWRNAIQVNVNPYIPPRGSTQYQINAGQARQYGMEFETTVIPWEGMTIDGNFAYLHSKYKAGSYLVVDPVTSAVVDHSDDPLNQSPKYQWGIGATQRVPVQNIGVVSIHADYSHVSKSYRYPNATAGPAVLAAGAVPGRSLLNARLALEIPDRNLELSFWSRNLLNEHYITTAFNGLFAPLGVSAAAVGAPRTFGGTVAVSW